ncbi:uncharacterized protein LOC144762415 [Lissotriton helveticus]
MGEEGEPCSVELDLAMQEEAGPSREGPGGELPGWRDSKQFWARFAAIAKANSWEGWELAMAQLQAPTPLGSGHSNDMEKLQMDISTTTGHIYSLPQVEQGDTKKKSNGGRDGAASRAKRTKMMQEEKMAVTGDSTDKNAETSFEWAAMPVQPMGKEKEPSDKKCTLKPKIGKVGEFSKDTLQLFKQWKRQKGSTLSGVTKGKVGKKPGGSEDEGKTEVWDGTVDEYMGEGKMAKWVLDQTGSGNTGTPGDGPLSTGSDVNKPITTQPRDGGALGFSERWSLAWHIPVEVKERVWKREFIDIFTLLEHRNRGTDTFKGAEQDKESKYRKRVRPKENIVNWLDAFALLAAIILEKYPDQGLPLFRYNQAIQERFRRFGGKCWLLYDLDFRERMEGTPGMSWDQREADGWMEHMGSDAGYEVGLSGTELVLQQWPTPLWGHALHINSTPAQSLPNMQSGLAQQLLSGIQQSQPGQVQTQPAISWLATQQMRGSQDKGCGINKSHQSSPVGQGHHPAWVGLAQQCTFGEQAQQQQLGMAGHQLVLKVPSQQLGDVCQNVVLQDGGQLPPIINGQLSSRSSWGTDPQLLVGVAAGLVQAPAMAHRNQHQGDLAVLPATGGSVTSQGLLIGGPLEPPQGQVQSFHTSKGAGRFKPRLQRKSRDNTCHLFNAANTSDCALVLAALQVAAHGLGMPLAAGKTEVSTMRLTFLGIELDSTEGVSQLPDEKNQDFAAAIKKVLAREKAALKDIQELLVGKVPISVAGGRREDAIQGGVLGTIEPELQLQSMAVKALAVGTWQWYPLCMDTFVDIAGGMTGAGEDFET